MRPPESWASARLTLALTLVTAAVFAVTALFGLQEWAIGWGGFIPARFSFEMVGSAAPPWLTPLTATLVHAHILHLGLNLLILVFCGRPTEAVLGRSGIAILYLVGAYAAAAAQYAVGSESMIPMIGASGAISAVLGAYAVLFGRNRVKIANPTAALMVHALWLMAAWIALQLIVALAAPGLGIAVAAHIGGFVAGVLLANPLLLFRYRKA